MMVIWQSLNMACTDHCMFWTACTLGYFGFLRSAEFTVPSMASFSTSLHLTVRDIAIDGISAPSCRCIRIKASKTDPFRKRAEIHIGWGVYPLCAVQSHHGISHAVGQCPGPLVSGSRWLPSVSRTSRRLEFFKPQLSHRGSNSGCS